MKLAYTLTFEDYKEAQALHVKRSLKRRLSYFVWYRAVPAIAVLLMGVIIVSVINHRWAGMNIAFPAEGALIWLSIYLPFIRSRHMRKGFKRLYPKSRTDNISSIVLEEDQILSGIPGVSEAKFFWAAIDGFAQNELTTLLYVNKTGFLFFPTSVMTSEQRIALGDLIKRKGIPQ
jgi:hypothetical protein